MWLMLQGQKGVEGDPVATIKKADDLAVSRYVQGLMDRSRNHMERVWYRLWQRNLYFCYGAQHIEQDEQGRWHPRSLCEDERHVTNLMLQRSKKRVSKKAGAKPTWRVIPRDSTPEELGRARSSEKLLIALHDHKDVVNRRIMMEISRDIFGSGFLKFFWDPNAGAPRKPQVPMKDSEGQPVMGDNSQPVMMEAEHWEVPGDLCVREVLAIYFHAPSSATSGIIDDLDWCGERTPVSLSDIWQRYRYQATPDATADDPLARLSNDFMRFMEASDLGMHDARPRDQAYVYEYHEKARLIPGFEQGIIVTVINNKLVSVRAQQLPPELGYPYVHYMGWPRPNTFWGWSDMNEEIEPQRAYNKDRMKMGQARDLSAVPWLWDPLGSGIPEGALTDGPRVLKGVQEPKFIGPPAISQALVEDTQQTLMDMDRVDNQFPLNRGESPGKSPFSADAIQLMKEGEESVMQPEILMGAIAHAAAGHKVLELVKRNMTEERMYEVGGASADHGAFLFSGSMVPTVYSVQVQESSSMYQMKGALRAEVMQAMQLGLFGQDVGVDPVKNQKLLDYMQFPNPTDLVPPEELNRRMAVREAAELLERGQPPTVNPLEQKMVHFQEHILRMMQPDFKRWERNYQEMWVKHITETQQLLQQEQAAQQQAMFTEGITQAIPSAVEKGKFRDSEAMLLAIKGILEGLEEKQGGGDAGNVGPPA